MYNNIDLDLRNTNAFLRKVFVYMSLGILVSFGVAFYALFINPNILYSISRYFSFLIIAQVAMVLSLSFAINKISGGTAKLLFFLYAGLTGLTLTGVGLAYDVLTILYAFTTTFIIFVVTAIFGYATQEDLSSYRRFFMIGLISLIIMGIINIFLGVGLLYWIETILGVVIFSGLIAYGVNRIKYLAYNLADADGENLDNLDKYSVIGALSLYLDFINLFLYILRIFGRKK
ncbi:MAG: Bax inhibitor-1/YccA family protein [Fusobacterium sp.]|nr:Bax inhibitor-1/YccA family protein [Fusobacterium sp.]